MRVIAGAVRGFRLSTPAGMRTRPTADRVREALFNILNPYVPDSQVLDLFAGSGAVGIEALSRGAARAVFVESHPAALKALRSNLIKTGMVESAEVLPWEVEEALKYLEGTKDRFDLVYIDPPYSLGLIESTLKSLVEKNIVADQGVVVAESSTREIPPEQAAGFQCYRRKTYGDTTLNFYSSKNKDFDGGI